jgi:tetratricopeptide (TPR) repeat protein
MTTTKDGLLKVLKRSPLSQDTFETLTALCELPDAAFKERAATMPELRSIDVASTLVERAHVLVTIEPGQAVLLAHLATRVIALVSVEDVDVDSVFTVEADAWGEYTVALREVGDLHQAIGASDTALRFYRVCPRLRAEQGHVLLNRAYVFFALGEVENAFESVVDAEALFDALGDEKGRLFASVCRGNLLLKNKEYDAAKEVYEAAASIAVTLNDTRTLAHIVNSAGICAHETNDFDGAHQCLSTALQMMDDFGWTSDTIKVRRRLAKVLISRGRVNEAISELYTCHNLYLAGFQPLMAAEVATEIADALLMTRRVDAVALLCEQALVTFEKAGLHREAQKALDYLRRTALERHVTADDVSRVRYFIERLQQYPDSVFEEEKAS